MLRSTLVSIAILAVPAFAAFGITASGTKWTVDTNAGLVFTVESKSADITSILYNSKQAQDQSKFSHISSGLGSATCTNARTGNNNNYIVITCKTSTLTQYVRASPTTAEPSIGELRFIARLSRSMLPNGPTVATMYDGTAIEASEVCKVRSETRSKFYSSKRFIDDQIHGLTGSGIVAYMIIPGVGYETAAGGPFFRDIDFQGSAQQELYFYMNSGHAQTETYRQGFHGPYALWFTSGAAPSSSFDTTFWESLGVTGLTKSADRGYVRGKATGVPSTYASNIVIGWSNAAAQYWTRAASDGSFTSPKMKAGTYTQSLYKGELVVGSTSVVVFTGTTVTANIADTNSVDTTLYIWKIGEFDGTPSGFLNADKIETMHPSDARMSSWGPITYTVGSSPSAFPMAIFKAIGAVTVKFTLTSAQTGARTLKIGTTLAFAGGRPQVKVNSWTSAAPAAPSQPDSRGVTRGTYRGNNIEYTYAIPSGTLTAGANSLTINVISGSSGDMFLSPNIVFDAVALY